MKRILIIYKSEHGATKQYAEWLHEAFPASTLMSVDGFTDDLNNYEIIVIGSCVYGGKMPAVEFLEANWAVLSSKQVYFFSVGAVPPESIYSKESYESIPEKIREKIQYIKLPGQIAQANPSIIEKWAFKTFLKGDPNIKVDKLKLAPVISYINEAAN